MAHLETLLSEAGIASSESSKVEALRKALATPEALRRRFVAEVAANSETRKINALEGSYPRG